MANATREQVHAKQKTNKLRRSRPVLTHKHDTACSGFIQKELDVRQEPLLLHAVRTLSQETEMAHQAAIQKPVFGSAVIQAGRKDGYWVETIKFDQKDLVPGIIAYVSQLFSLSSKH